MGKHTIQELKQMQSLPLELKIKMTQRRIEEWVKEYGADGVYISFSGGKDSTVLLDIARKMYPNIKAMFVDTPTQYPELRDFVKTFDNVDIVKPKISFAEVCEKYGFPLISKEVAESVAGARKYLTALLEQQTMSRQTDRQTDRLPYAQFYRKITGQGEYAKATPSVDKESLERMSRGGYDRKYRRIRGLGEFNKEWKGQQIATGSSSRNVRQRESDKGEYP